MRPRNAAPGANWRDSAMMVPKRCSQAGLAKQAAGNVKQGVGKAVGNDRLRAEGPAQEAKGKVQKAVGGVKSAVKETTYKTTAEVNKKLGVLNWAGRSRSPVTIVQHISFGH